MNFLFLLLIHIVRTHKGEGEGSTQMRTIAYKGGGGFKVAYVSKNDFFWTAKSQNLSFFFCTKEANTLSFIIVYRKV